MFALNLASTSAVIFWSTAGSDDCGKAAHPGNAAAKMRGGNERREALAVVDLEPRQRRRPCLNSLSISIVLIARSPFSSMVGPEVASRERILLEQSGNHGRVKVGAYAYDHAVLEIHDPAVTVIEPHTVLGRGQ